MYSVVSSADKLFQMDEAVELKAHCADTVLLMVPYLEE